MPPKTTTAKPGVKQTSRPGNSQVMASVQQSLSQAQPQITLSFASGGSLMPKTQSFAQKRQKESGEKVLLSDIITAPQHAKQTIRKSSNIQEQKPKLTVLPFFAELPPSEHQNNFVQKLQQCCIGCNWLTDAPPAAIQDRELKGRYLRDMVGYITNGKNVFPEQIWPYLLRMVQANIFRILPLIEKSPLAAQELDEEEPNLDPAWQHLQFVYEILFRFVLSNEVDPKVAIKYFTSDFIHNLIDLFDSEDPRERDGLKSTLHRIYSRFWPRRPFIRNVISHKFHRSVFNQITFNGIAELLEILGSIIHGFGVPVKQEHKLFLTQTLLPLHKASNISTFHMQLSNCMILFVEKDPQLAQIIVSSLLRYWPRVNSQKQILFLAELEDLIDSMHLEDMLPLSSQLFKKISECIQSSHFQVAERAISMLSNEYLLQLVSQTRAQTIPLLFMALYTNTKTHWNQSVVLLTFSALKLFMEMDNRLFSQCATSFKRRTDQEARQKVARDLRWDTLEKAVIPKRVQYDTLLQQFEQTYKSILSKEKKFTYAALPQEMQTLMHFQIMNGKLQLL
ncbi:MAG: putative Serine/threonine-protein phosphatase 2A 56 kDa regulatory subunit gamma [Streblomastix strix]|uniref:Putative Serine/threonine-protein phosphatase 2A 56 kDa regulatory subunit gamma n=1 Tax=Streblomastix strix TaxID=222440 RepID=A0A5J4VZV1_9EUKA|nr:MAG: putative Serine/threonine-protein phosphatase 2A 56 kDa regulatory subunit gamma [Streblomastix strix]